MSKYEYEYHQATQAARGYFGQRSAAILYVVCSMIGFPSKSWASCLLLSFNITLAF